MKIVRRILRILGLLVLLVVALVAGATAVLTLTQSGRDTLAGLISSIASSEGSTVTISGLSGIWAGPLEIDSVALADGEGPWLVLRGAAIEWSPLALLSSTFEASLVHADRVELARLPKSSSEDTASGGGLPVSLAIDRIDLPEIAIGGALAGEVAEISAKGSLHAEAEPLAVKADIAVQRTDGKQGRIDARVDFAPAEERLAIDLHGAEPAGGIIANLLKLPGAPPVEFSVAGKGPAANWDLTGTFSLDGSVVTSIAAKRQLTDAGNQIEAKGEGQFERFMPQSVSALVAGQSSFQFTGLLGDDGAIRIERATLQSAALNASAQGTIYPAGVTDLAIEAAANGSPARLTFGEGTSAVKLDINRASVRAFGRGEAPALDVNASLAKVKTAQAELSDVAVELHSDAFDIANRSGPLTLAASAAGATSADEHIAAVLPGALKLDAVATLAPDSVHIERGNFASDKAKATVSGDVSLVDGSLALDVKADAPATVLPEAVRFPLGGSVAVATMLSRDASGAFKADALSVKSGALDFSGSVAYGPQALDLAVSGSFADLAHLTPQVGGKIGFDIAAKGSPAAPDVTATITSERLTAAGREIDAVELSVSGKADMANPALDLSLKATMAGEAIAGKAALNSTNGQRRIEGLSVTLRSNSLKGDLALTSGLLPEGTLTFDLADIGALAKLVPDEARGAANGTAALSVTAGVPNVAIVADVATLKRGDLSIENANVKADIADYVAEPAMSGTIKAQALTSGATVINNVDVSLKREGSSIAFAGGASVQGVDARAEGRLAIAGGATTIDLGSASAKMGALSATLADPTTISVRDGAATLDHLKLAAGSGSVEITGTAGEQLDLDLQLAALPVDLAKPFAPGIDLSGALSGSAHVSRAGAGQAMNLALDVAAAGAPVAIRSGEGEAAVTAMLSAASVKAVGSGDVLTLDATAKLDKVTTSQAELTGIEASLHSDAFDVAKRTGPLTVAVTAASAASGDEHIAALLPGVLKLDAAGTLSPDSVRIERGSFASDKAKADVSGDVSLIDGSLVLGVQADIPATVLPETVRLPLGGNLVVATKLSRDASGALKADALSLKSGALDLAGNVAYGPQALDLALSGSFADLAHLSPQVGGRIGFDIAAKGSPAAPDVTATITSEKLTAAGRDISAVELSVSGKADMANPDLDLSAKATMSGEALTARASLTTANGLRRIEALSLTLGANSVKGDFVLNSALLPEGLLTLDLADISAIARLVPEAASGSAKGTARLSFADGSPRVAIMADVPTLKRGDLSIENANIDAVVTNLLAGPQVSGKVKAQRLTSSATVINNVDVSLKREGSSIGFAGGASVQGIDARAEGRLAIAGGVTTIDLASASATMDELSATLAEPTTVSVRDAAAALDHVRLAVGTGSVEITGTAGQQLDLDVQLAALPVGIAKPFVSGIGLSGALSGSARVSRAGAEQPMNVTLDVAATGTPVAIKTGEGDAAVTIMLDSVSAKAAGAGDVLALDATAKLDKVTTAQAEFTGIEARLHSDAFNVAKHVGPVTVAVTAASGGSVDEQIAGLLAGALKLEASGTLVPESVHIASGGFASDSVKASVVGDVSLADGSLKLDLNAELIAGLLPATTRPALAKTVNVSAKVARDAAGVLDVQGLSIRSGAFDASGNVAYGPDRLDVQLKGGFADVSKVSPDAAGAIGFDIRASGSPAIPDISATITSERLLAAGREISGFELSASGKADMANPSASVSVKGNVAGQALAGEAVLKTANGERRIDGLSLTLGANTLKGDLVLDQNMVPEGALAFTLPDIAPLAALAFDKASGAVSGSVRFSRADGVPQVALDARAASIARGDLAVANAAITGLVADYLGAPVVSGKAKAATVKSGTTVVSNVDVTLTRDGSWTGFKGGAIVDGIDLQAAGRAAIAAGMTTVELASASAKMRGLVAALSRPTTVRMKDGTTTLDRVTLAVGGGSVAVSGTAGAELNLDVQISALPAGIADAFAPGVKPSGTIGGSVRVSGAAASPQIGYQLESRNAETAQTRDAGFGAMAISSTGTFSQNVLKFTASIGDASGLGLKGGGSVDTSGKVMTLDFAGQVPFGFLTRRLAAQGLALSGTSSVKLSLRGSLNSPAIGGSITASGVRLVDARSGLAVNGIDLDIAIASGTATIRKLSGTLSSGGTLSGSGTVGIDAAKGFPANLAVKMVDARYTDGRIVTANLSGDIAIKGPLATQPLLSGTINLAKTVITIPERLPGSAAALGVRHKNATAAVRRQAEEIRPASAGGNGGGSGMALDLTINAPREIFVRGRGLDAELGGSIRLTGPLSSPRAVGEFTLRRGRLTVLARRLDFTRGTLGFSGALIPSLDLAAESRVADTTITVGVSGLATDPKFTFTSSPTLPQDEVLARLIFGRSLSNLSPIQIAQLADAASQLAGGGGSSSLFEKLRKNLGVDDLDVKTDSKGGTSVAAGKYLNDRTYLSVQQGDRAGSTKATIDLDVGRGVKLRGEAGADGSAEAGIFYEREY